MVIFVGVPLSDVSFKYLVFVFVWMCLLLDRVPMSFSCVCLLVYMFLYL